MSKEKKNSGKSNKHGDFSKFIKKKTIKVAKIKLADKPRKKQQRQGTPIDVNAVQKEGNTYNDPIRLNRFIANAGVCSRRDADQLIADGLIKVNGKVVSEMGYKVLRTDKVVYKGKDLIPEKPVYVLLNKPKGFITTTDDPFERKTVMKLVEKACQERILPVGRLDRNTTGLLLFTNDGELAKKLTHPSHSIRKLYHVFLDKPLEKNDFLKIVEGLELDDGIIKVDKIAYVESENDKKQIGIELHSGRNRIVRRIFESLGYAIEKLDRVSMAGLTKKDIPRGKWRFLKDIEISKLKGIK